MADRTDLIARLESAEVEMSDIVERQQKEIAQLREALARAEFSYRSEDNITVRLRKVRLSHQGAYHLQGIEHERREAADEIERLRADLKRAERYRDNNIEIASEALERAESAEDRTARLREALEWIAEESGQYADGRRGAHYLARFLTDVEGKAREALK